MKTNFIRNIFSLHNVIWRFHYTNKFVFRQQNSILTKGGYYLLVYKNVKFFAFLQDKSIREVEDGAGINRGTIEKWKKSTPQRENLDKIVKYFGCSYDDILAENDFICVRKEMTTE